MNGIEVVSIQEIEKLYSPGIGRHWFDADTMRFFRTRLADCGYKAADGTIYFASTEKNPSGVRKGSIRRFMGPGKIATVGEFHSYGNMTTADKHARRIAEESFMRGREQVSA